MLGGLYDRALDGETTWIRYDTGEVHPLPVRSWIGGADADDTFDNVVMGLCTGPTIDLGCGPGRFVSQLIRLGIPALGIDLSHAAVDLARRNGAPTLRRDLFAALPGTGRWQTGLLVDGNIGIGGDPTRVLRRTAELLRRGGHCVVELDPAIDGVVTRWQRLESAQSIGPWFRWAAVGVGVAATLADGAGLSLTDLHTAGQRVVATLAAV